MKHKHAYLLLFLFALCLPMAGRAAPGQVSLVSPIGGEIADAPPVLTWNPPTPSATWYQIGMDRNGTFYQFKWVQAPTTLWQTPSDMPDGDYAWGIRGWSPSGYGDWSVTGRFTLLDQRPPQSLPLSPTGGTTISDRTPTFSWQDVSPVYQYRLLIHRNGVPFMDTWMFPTSYTPTTELPPGNYTWWIQTGNTIGLGPWGGPASFRIEPRIPTAVSLIAPSGMLRGPAGDIDFRWWKQSVATWYNLVITTGGGIVWDQWYNQTGIGEGLVTLTGFTPEKTYKWWIRAQAPEGAGPWSSASSFIVRNGLPAKPILESPTGTLSEQQPGLNWRAADGATWYHIFVRNRATGAESKGWLQNTTALPSGQLPYGDYRWWVSSYNGASQTEVWSDPLDFTLAASGGQIVGISLTWGQTPSDLDANLLVPGQDLVRWTFGSETAAPFAKSYEDDTSSFGPENIAIYNFYTGTYQYYVRTWGGSSSLPGSEAEVTLFDALGDPLQSWTVPSSGSGAYWHVFDIDGDTGIVTSRNVIQASAPTAP